VSDRIEKTIDYHEACCQEMLKFGEGRSWKLLERLSTAIADHILAEYKPQAVLVEVKKFIIPQTATVFGEPDPGKVCAVNRAESAGVAA